MSVAPWSKQQLQLIAEHNDRSVAFSVGESQICAESDGYIVEFQKLVVCYNGYLAEKKSTYQHDLLWCTKGC